MLQYVFRLKELAPLVDADIRGDSECLISGIMTLRSAKTGQISFLNSRHYLKHLLNTEASAVIMRPEYMTYSNCNALITPEPYLAFAKIAKLFEKQKKSLPGVHATSILEEGCFVHPSASISAFCFIGAGAYIDAGVVIGAACVLAETVRVGANSRLEANVTLCADTVLGERVVVHSGSVIGSDGFGLAKDKEKWVKIPQLGKVCVGNDVEIGANVTIDRGALEDTFIGDGVKLDNQIQIGHNVRIGSNTAIAGCTGIAGSTYIGKNCMIAGGVCMNGHIEVTDNVIITGSSTVVHSIRKPGVYSSTQSAQPQKEWQKNSARFRQLDKIARALKQLEIKINANSTQTSHGRWFALSKLMVFLKRFFVFKLKKD